MAMDLVCLQLPIFNKSHKAEVYVKFSNFKCCNTILILTNMLCRKKLRGTDERYVHPLKAGRLR